MLAISCPDCWELVATLLLNQPSLNVRYSAGHRQSGKARDLVRLAEARRSRIPRGRIAIMATTPELRAQLRSAFTWRGDRWDDSYLADVTGWWRDPKLLVQLGPALAELHRHREPTVILGLQSRGSLLGPLVAQSLGVGFVEVRKEPSPAADSDDWVEVTTPPDYRDRHLTLGFRRRLVVPEDRVLLVDDWIDTGGQALGTRALVTEVGASWIGVAVVVDALSDHAIRRDLSVKCLVHMREL